MSLNQRSLERQDYWQNKIKLWEEGGLSQSEYCRQNNIDQQQFSKWKIRLSKNTKNKFVRINVKLRKDFPNPACLELVIKENYTIKIHSDFNPDTLKKLIETIGG